MSEQLIVCKALAAMIRNHGEPSEEEVNYVAHAAFELALNQEQNEEVEACCWRLDQSQQERVRPSGA